ncbi:efflux RND transporter permease subunit [Planctomycetes bacterium K23_9]|uniref:MMPL family protein n=1 Tax=Stieleria marina TaxID=1930275 RepID=A0A517NQZ2_9BACT|nr:MMPL family protein [Planctomycetes bacterium K23_9]
MSFVSDSSLNATSSELDLLRRRYLRRWKFGLAILLLLAIPASVHSAAAIATLRNIPDQWLPSSLPLKQDFAEYIRRFGHSDVLFISWPGARLDDDEVQSVAMLLRGMSTEVAEPLDDSEPLTPLDQFDSESVPDAIRTFWKDARAMCDDATPLVWVRSGTEIRDSMMRRPLSLSDRSATRRLKGTFVGPDGQKTCVLASFAESSGSHHRQLLPLMQNAIAEMLRRPAEEVVFVGACVNGAAVDNEAIASIEKYTIPSSVLAAVLCWLCLRSIPLTFTILSIATVGQGMVLATVFYFGTPMNAILIVLPPLVFVLTVSSGIHLSNYYFDFARDRQVSRIVAAQQAMRIGVPPCLIATFTTVVGLMSLYLVRLEPVRMFGMIGSIGVLSTLALMIMMLPGAMLLARVSTKQPSADTPVMTQSIASKASPFWLRPFWILLIFAALSSSAVVGFGRLTTSVSVPKMFHPESELRQSYVWYESNVGATMTAELLLSFDDPLREDRANRDPSVRKGDAAIKQLRQVMRVHAAVVDLPAVGGGLSAASFLPIPSKSRSVSGTISRSVIRAQVADENSVIHQLAYVDRAKDEQTWRISLRLFQTHEYDFGDSIELIEQTAREALLVAADESPKQESDVKIKMTGHVVIIDGSQQLLLKDLFTSFLAAFGVIAILMSIYLRSIRGGLFAMLPNFMPTLILFGAMGWLRWPLDIGSVMTASVALGIAVDDSIHLLAQYRRVRATEQSRIAAAVLALRHCGWAMLQTTIVCSLSLLVYGLSPFLPTQRFAFFMMGLLLLAWIGVSTLLPAIMSTRLGDYFTGTNASG